ncbi:ribosome biogenesis GTP-binding protein YihA/YsxC [Buchnera aphidicola]|uniref:ribosome biogenesis GTP-binding protein YihA/YsxC n=1 Tax=Buchnera aphidicola TaxID=9 RepID=UPI00346418BB
MFVLNYNKTYFLNSFSKINDINIQDGIEIAFVGYSNSGKSSAINALTNKKNLARFSKMPGRTQLINFFQVNSEFRIVDLPGYGYATAPEIVKLKWQKILYHYLEKRDFLKGIILLMDIRYPLKKLDYKILDLVKKRKIFFLVLLTKSDKMTLSQQNHQFKIVQNELNNFIHDIPVVLFSSIRKTGINILKNTLNLWHNSFL